MEEQIEKFQVIIGERADRKIDALHLYLQEFIGQGIADKFVNGLVAKIAGLNKHPGRGANLRNINTSIPKNRKFIRYKNYAIIYKVVELRVMILDIRHFSQDISRIKI